MDVVGLDHLDSSLQAWHLPDNLSHTGVRVVFSVEDSSRSSADRDGDDTTDDDHSRLPGGPWVPHLDAGLLGAVGEVVVPGAHVVVRAEVGHLHEATVEVGSGSVEHHAVLEVLLYGTCIVVVLGEERAVVEAVGLTDVRHEEAGIGVLEEGGLGVGDGVVLRHIGDLHDVGAVSGGPALSSIASGVGVTPSPLEMNEVVLLHFEVSGDKVVLGGGVGLHDVSSLSTNVQVVDRGAVGYASRAGDDAEHVAAVLEDTTGLRGVEGESEVDSGMLNSRILSNG